MILHHKTLFGTTEHTPRSVARAAAARQRLAGWLGEHPEVAGVVLTSPAAVAWATGAVAPPVDRTAGVDLVWVVATRSSAALVTTEVEADRVAAEYQPRQHGFADLAAVAWYDPDGFTRAAQDIAGAPADRLAADGHPAFGRDAADDLVALRLALSPAEQQDLRALGADAADALQQALASWRPGQRDLDVQAQVAALLEARGADTPVLIVGGDDRLRRFRHPMAAGAPVRELIMAVVVARRGGLHAAATRFASAGPVGPEYAALRARVLRVERATLAASAPPNRYGDVLAALADGYARDGAPGGWAGHYQGGPIGYAQREFEIAPGQHDSRWYATAVGYGQAIAWNPSLPGGAKAEDTYLVTETGLERVTTAADGPGPGWPAETEDDELIPPRPAVLEVA